MEQLSFSIIPQFANHTLSLTFACTSEIYHKLRQHCVHGYVTVQAPGYIHSCSHTQWHGEELPYPWNDTQIKDWNKITALHLSTCKIKIGELKHCKRGKLILPAVEAAITERKATWMCTSIHMTPPKILNKGFSSTHTISSCPMLISVPFISCSLQD